MKSNLHRRVVGTTYQANDRSLLPPWKLKYKAQGNARVRIADCMLAADELVAHVEGDDVGKWRDSVWLSFGAPDTDRDEQEMLDIEQQRYRAWAEGTAYPNENRGRYYDSTYDDSRYEYQDSIGYQDQSWPCDVVHSVNGYDVTLYHTNRYHVEHRYSFIGCIELLPEAMQWQITYLPVRGEQEFYQFDYLDTSIEAATQLLMMLHKLDTSNLENDQ
ncbi:MAG: hypothetical protein HXX17_07980 [Geobacteraceae bacterium]|nr:hypothetical protein [Geobacteraceae bacterium]